MALLKISTYFQTLISLATAPRLALVAGLVLAMVPSHPLRGGNGHWVELMDRAEGREAWDLLRIYSVLRTHRTDLKDATAWEIGETILRESLKYSLDPLLVLAVINVESRFQHVAVSSEGARGLMQIRPFVGLALAEEPAIGLGSEANGLNAQSLDDPFLNIKLGVFYLNELQKSFKDIKLALTAYNWGPTEIRNRLDGKEPIPRGYADKVLASYQRYRNPFHPSHQAFKRKS